MLTLLIGPDWIQNRDEIFARIAQDVKQKKENRILMVPELISHDTERRLAYVAGDTSSRFAQVLSFTRLARRIMDLVGSGAQESMDSSGRLVAMAAAARQLHSRLKVYASVETKPEFLSQLMEAVDEFKRCCISSRDLMNASARVEGSFAQKLEELSLLMDSYDALCANGKRDPRDQMTWVLEQLKDLDFASRHVFYVDGFPDFTRQNMAILEHIIVQSPHVTISLTCDSLYSDNMAFEEVAETALHLKRFADHAGIPVKIETISPRRDHLSVLREKLFQGKLDTSTGSLQAMKANSVAHECQIAAQKIMDMVQQGARYRDFSVVCPDINRYIPILRMVFQKCEIPLYFAGTEDVLRSGVISTVILGLEAALGGFEQRDMLRYLRSSLSPLCQDDCDRMENYVTIWSVSGKRWTESWTMHPQGLKEEWSADDRRQLADLEEKRQLVMQPLLRLRTGFRSAANLGHQIRALYQFLEEISFADHLSLLADSMDDCGDNRNAQILQQLWEILLSALEQMYDVLGETVWEDERFVRLLKLLLSQCDVGTIPPVLDAVSAGSISAMRCQSQKHLIVLGADEGSLPSYGASTGLLSDRERVDLRAMGVPITGGAMDGLQAEFAEIYGVFCGATETVTVVSSAAQPSFVFTRVAALSGGEIQAEPVEAAQYRKPIAAASLLVQKQDEDTAHQIGLQQQYDKILQGRNHSLGTISSQQIQGLYGSKLHLSASQIDRQAECRLSYFLRYGLRAQERKPATVDPAEFGTFVHWVLEQTASDVMEKGGFHHVTLEETLELASHYAQDYIDQKFRDLDSQRLRYLFRRNLQELQMVVQELWRELHLSEFKPSEFELRFGRDGKMPGVDIPNASMPAVLQGFVDRVDVWRRGESTYFRVVDYKTGKKDFDYCDVYNGVGLQMLLYLFALESNGEEILSGKPVGVGVQYFPARAKYLTCDGALTDEDAQNLRRSEWKRSGLILSDLDTLHAMDPSEKLDTLSCSIKKDGTITGDVASRQQLGLLRDYIMKWLGGMVKDIASGNIEPNPYTRGNSHDACTFCPYSAVCHQNTVPGRRNYKTMNAQRFWEEVEKEVENNG